jgi:hypothetical protein
MANVTANVIATATIMSLDIMEGPLLGRLEGIAVHSTAACDGRHKIRLSPKGMFGVDKARRSDGADPVTGELAAEGEANVFQIGRAACNPAASVCPPTFVHSSGAKTYPISCFPGFSSRGRDQNL